VGKKYPKKCSVTLICETTVLQFIVAHMCACYSML